MQYIFTQNFAAASILWTPVLPTVKGTVCILFHIDEGEDYTKTLRRGQITKKKGNKEETLQENRTSIIL